MGGWGGNRKVPTCQLELAYSKTTVHRPPSTVHRPPSTVHRPTDHRPPTHPTVPKNILQTRLVLILQKSTFSKSSMTSLGVVIFKHKFEPIKSILPSFNCMRTAEFQFPEIKLIWSKYYLGQWDGERLDGWTVGRWTVGRWDGGR